MLLRKKISYHGYLVSLKKDKTVTFAKVLNLYSSRKPSSENLLTKSARFLEDSLNF
jgi:hypothetical protein